MLEFYDMRNQRTIALENTARMSLGYQGDAGTGEIVSSEYSEYSLLLGEHEIAPINAQNPVPGYVFLNDGLPLTVSLNGIAAAENAGEHLEVIQRTDALGNYHVLRFKLYPQSFTIHKSVKTQEGEITVAASAYYGDSVDASAKARDWLPAEGSDAEK